MFLDRLDGFLIFLDGFVLNPALGDGFVLNPGLDRSLYIWKY